MRAISLLPEDEEFLDFYHLNKWEIKEEGETKFGLVISSFRLPQGYSPEEATLMLIVPQSYPVAQIDMFYFNPLVKKSNGDEITKLTQQTHFGIEWQQWSRHYTWVPGGDNIAKHIQFVSKTLEQEGKK